MSAFNGEFGGPLSHIWDRERVLAPLLIAPAILYIVVLVGAPFFLAVYYSLSDATTGSQSLHFVGLSNFQAVLKDPVFRKSLINTFIFTLVSQALVLVLAKVLALALLKDFRGKWLVKFLILLPWTAPIALGTIGWMWMLDSIFSPIDWILRYLGLLGAPGAILGANSNLYWLGVPSLAMLSVILVHTWRMLPLATVILLAGLTSIPQEILDAAEVDGAGFWRRLFQIMIPMLLPIMTVAVLFGIVFTFTDIAVVYILTQGGPVHSTQVLASWAFFKGIEAGDLAQGAAVALFLFPAMAGVAALMLRLARRTEVT
ncbi:MAG: sugar ABC transporter permease [Deltaproteobacteria bacterium]|nr:sugar ABC transporter permease [Deltaproteobacteria bacterium]MDH3773042.1 sugar ABC transporter permease [Deltaproteobacteria bacterium]MDH3801526.1 sugar ABC transporter permease [Deltaproteobacteria bacterium]MDH3896855.1 sugar ABC transporter permease [Deltaproteobacteria bacterium]MDH3927503.1 sugar ABC transporter permease [Deltaproteobacteria bacterium]